MIKNKVVPVLLKTGVSCCLLILLFPFYSAAQAILSGSVYDFHKKPVDLATVNLINAKDSSLLKSTITNQSGLYSFQLDVSGDFFISVSSIGYNGVKSKPFQILSPGKAVSLETLILSENRDHNLKEVSVVGKNPLVERKLDRTVINIANSVVSSGGTAMEALETAPNVSIDKDGNLSLYGKQGVTVTINDKRSNLAASEVLNYLRSLPAQSIKSIELISNPSANYDASGSGGIINIRLKDNLESGSTGSVSGMFGYGKHYKAYGGINYNYRSKKVNLSLGYSASSNKRYNDQTVQRFAARKSDSTFFDQTADRVRKIDYQSISAGLDYQFNADNKLQFQFDGGFHSASQVLDNETFIGNSVGRVDSVLRSSNPLKDSYSSLNYSLGYTSQLDTLGQKISVDVTYGNFSFKEHTLYNNYYYKPDGTVLHAPDFLQIHAPININIYSAKSDYVYPLTRNSTLSTGVKFTMVKTNNDFRLDSLRNNVWENTLLSNHFKYSENVNAGYISYSGTFDKFSVKAGIRAEQTNSEGISTVDNSVKRNYFNLFPTLYLSDKISEDHTVSMSYGRRIDRPSYEDLNPFLYFLDKYTFSQGNPFLEPQYTNIFELSYALKNTYSVAFGYSHTNNVMSEVVITDDVKQTLIFTYKNLAKLDSYYSSLNIPVSITKWWDANNNFNFYLNRISTPDILGETLDKRKFSYQINSNHTFNLFKNYKAELSFSYLSPNIQGTLNYTKPVYGFDFGVKRSFLQKRASLNLAVKDIFNTRARTYSSLLPSQNYKYYQKLETQMVRLSFVYNFGNLKLNTKRDRSDSSNEEYNRIKTTN